MTTLLPVVFARKSYPRSPMSPSEAKKRNCDTSAIVSGVREQATAATATCLMVFDFKCSMTGARYFLSVETQTAALHPLVALRNLFLLLVVFRPL